MKRVVTFAVIVAACAGADKQSTPIPGDRGSAITAEVLNASGRAGDARVATRALRQAGIDVVYFGNAAGGALDSTRIIVRRGGREAAERVRAALGQGRIAIELDSDKLLDVSVLLGADFAGAASTRRLGFHP
ncbi:MAG TPA: LytR C-terminal domain-containing protein [Gemmatimonadales bacterium]|nr:LytR C-terminal domain-containing protein [Gemmatimonadales bacterium]